MARKRDYKPLLDAFKPDDSRPATKAAVRSIRLPSLAKLLEIDRKAEAEAARAQRAVPAARIDGTAFGVAEAIGETKGVARAADGSTQ